MWELKPSGRIIALLHRPPLCPFDTGWDFFLGLVHWDDPEGWDGEEGGRGVQYG